MKPFLKLGQQFCECIREKISTERISLDELISYGTALQTALYNNATCRSVLSGTTGT